MEITGTATVTVIIVDFMMDITDFIHPTIITQHRMFTVTMWPMAEFIIGTATGAVQADQQDDSAMDTQPPLTELSQEGVIMFQLPGADHSLTAVR